MKSVKKQYMIAISGVKNSGKTTFLEKLIPVLKAYGLQVAVIKHDGHDFVPEKEGTDTRRLRASGACGTAIFSRNRWMVAKDEPGMDEKRMAQLFPEADMILLEGMKQSAYPKIELVRGAVSRESVCAPETLLALVTDTDLTIPGVPVMGFDEVKKCAEILMEAWREQTKIGY